MVSDAEKIAAFDLLSEALTNKWASDKWSWWCNQPCGGGMRDSQEEAIQDLVAWAAKMAPRMKAKR